MKNTDGHIEYDIGLCMALRITKTSIIVIIFMYIVYACYWIYLLKEF